MSTSRMIWRGEFRDKVAARILARMGLQSGKALADWMDANPEKALAAMERARAKGEEVGEGLVACHADDVIDELVASMKGRAGDG